MGSVNLFAVLLASVSVGHFRSRSWVVRYSATMCRRSWARWTKDSVYYNTFTIQRFFICFEGHRFFSLLSSFWNKKLWEELIAYFPWYDTDRIENDVSNNSSIAACVFITALTFLLSRCLATIREFLPIPAVTYQRHGNTHTDTQIDGREF
jgi:hypothetical protein